MKKDDIIDLMKAAHRPMAGMVDMVPDDKLDWAPGPGLMSIGQVLKHLSENWCIVKMMVTKIRIR